QSAITRGLELRASRHDPLRFGLGLAQLGGQALASARELALALAELTGRAHQIRALGSDTNLLETQSLQSVALFGQSATPALDEAREMVSGLRALRDETLGLAQRTPSGLALGGEDVEALARHTDLLVESHHLFGRLAKLHAHLLTTLEEDRKSTRLNSSHDQISYAVFCLKK